MKLGVYIMAHEPILTTYVSLCVSLLGNGSVNTFPRQRIHAAIEELVDALLSVRFVSYQWRVRGSVCVTSIVAG
jgi:hypothetical protein